jgi:hypothetical protein
MLGSLEAIGLRTRIQKNIRGERRTRRERKNISGECQKIGQYNGRIRDRRAAEFFDTRKNNYWKVEQKILD